jgi:hypothetical protein
MEDSRWQMHMLTDSMPAEFSRNTKAVLLGYRVTGLANLIDFNPRAAYLDSSL